MAALPLPDGATVRPEPTKRPQPTGKPAAASILPEGSLNDSQEPEAAHTFKEGKILTKEKKHFFIYLR